MPGERRIGKAISEVSNTPEYSLSQFRDTMEGKADNAEGDIIICSHGDEDNDAITAPTLLRHFLSRKVKNKMIRVLTSDRSDNPKIAYHLPQIEQNGIELNDGNYVAEIRRAGLVVVVDTHDLARAGIPQEVVDSLEARGALMILDHHPGASNSENIHVDKEAGAASLLVYEMYIDEIMRHGLDKEIAKQLAVAIYVDTGGLAFASQETKSKYFDIIRNNHLDDTEVKDAVQQAEEQDLDTLRKTGKPLHIKDFRQDKVAIYYPPTPPLSRSATKLATDKVLNELLLREQDRYDFSLYVEPIVQEKPESRQLGRLIARMKMRAVGRLIAGEIARAAGFGGKEGAASMEYWPSPKEQGAWERGDDIKKQAVEAAITKRAIKLFKLLYTQARLRYDLVDSTALENHLDSDQLTTLHDRVSEFISTTDGEYREELMSYYGYASFHQRETGADLAMRNAFDQITDELSNDDKYGIIHRSPSRRRV